MLTRFHKMHGLGNDFVLFDAREADVAMDEARARALSDRNTGIGCDQLIVLRRSSQADAEMRIYNRDGGEVEACGNATRCAAQLIGGSPTIATHGGLLHADASGAATFSRSLLENAADLGLTQETYYRALAALTQAGTVARDGRRIRLARTLPHRETQS